MDNQGPSGNDYRKTQAGDADEERKIRQLAQERAFQVRGNTPIMAMKRTKRGSRKMER
jgi:hypothetical protein